MDVNLDFIKNINTPESKKIIRMANQVGLIPWSVSFIIILFLSGWAVIGPLNNLQLSISDQLDNTSVMVEKVQKVSGEGESFNVLMTQLRQEWHLIKSKTIRPEEHAKVIAVITKTIKDTKIKIINIQPLKSEEEEQGQPSQTALTPRQFQIEMEADYTSLGKFFHRLEKEFPIITVEKFEIWSAPSQPSLLNVKMVFAAYEEIK